LFEDHEVMGKYQQGRTRCVLPPLYHVDKRAKDQRAVLGVRFFGGKPVVVELTPELVGCLILLVVPLQRGFYLVFDCVHAHGPYRKRSDKKPAGALRSGAQKAAKISGSLRRILLP